MARRDPVAAKIAAIEDLRSDPESPGSLKVLREALTSHESLVIAAAATVARDGEVAALRPALAAALERLLDAPGEADRGCRAKHALADALLRCGHDDPAPFLRGIRHVQRDPIWGGSEDTAAALRATSAVALARTGHPDTLDEICRLLVDAERVARIGAAQAAGDLGDRAAVPLLRFKALSGDPDPEVIGEVLGSLLRLSTDAAVPFVADLLASADQAVAEAAAVALGESRLDTAFAPLATWSRAPECARVGLLAIALLRTDRALTHLLDTLTHAPPPIAAATLPALATWRDDPTVRERVSERVRARDLPRLSHAFAKAFATTME